jgi:hypothetical protein
LGTWLIELSPLFSCKSTTVPIFVPI